MNEEQIERNEAPVIGKDQQGKVGGSQVIRMQSSRTQSILLNLSLEGESGGEYGKCYSTPNSHRRISMAVDTFLSGSHSGI